MKYSVAIVIILLAGCVAEQNRCGDGICDSAERTQRVCPQDCGNNFTDAQPTLYVGLMVHIEGWDDEALHQQKFARHADAVRTLAALCEKYEARATFEARSEFVKGCTAWNDNVLLELYNRGHGIGVHADLGGIAEEKGLTQKDFAARLAVMKEEIESLIEVKIQHVSGICSSLDWVQAAIDAGYSFSTGSVGFCAMSLPPEERPPQYRFCTTPAECHGVLPEHIKDRINPWRTDTKRNWLEHDPQGRLTILAGSGELKYLGDEENSFTEKDITAFAQMLEEALSYAQPDTVNIFYVSLSIGDPHIDEVLFEKWFETIQTYVDAGQVEWKTLPQMYDAYRAWKTHHTHNLSLHMDMDLSQSLYVSKVLSEEMIYPAQYLFRQEELIWTLLF